MIWVYLSSGRGPAECEQAVAGIARRLCEEAGVAGLVATLLDEHPSRYGMLSMLIAVDGNGEAAFAQSWEGTIQWTCPSAMRGKASRRNWFISSSVVRQPAADRPLDDRDLTFAAARASGPGGQHVNKTNSAIRVVHRPTGLTAQAQEERSQARNKALAVARLAMLLDRRAAAGQQQLAKEKWQVHDDLVRGNPVRVYRGADFIRDEAL